MGRPPSNRPAVLATTTTNSNVQKSTPPVTSIPGSQKTSPKRKVAGLVQHFESPKAHISPAAVLVEPIKSLQVTPDIKDDEEETIQEIPQTVVLPKKKTRTKRKPRREATDNQDVDASIIPARETVRSKGWRQTPLLEPTHSFQPFATLKRKTQVQNNGWATEDASDVQDLGEFDFASNLSKFDKRTVFDQIKADDMTADEDRLVAHNRLPRPGTNGGKNLHPTENVLDMPSPTTRVPEWNSEASEPESLRQGSGSGRNSRRADSRLANVRKTASRKASAAHATQTTRPPLSSNSTANTKSALYLVPSNRKCEVISPLQMLNLENIADNELGLTEDMMAENAGRGIAEVALSALDGGVRRLTQDEPAALQTVIVFAGNNKSGLRAVAAGRHLRNHGIQVVICVLGLEREPELLEGLRRQLKIFRNFGGKVLSKAELMEWTKTAGLIDLVIDGLLGMTISFEELRTGDQASAYELIEWTNRCQISVLAIDVPTGIDPTSGKISIVDGKELFLAAKYVVAMGAPKQGLLAGLQLVGSEAGWQVFVADLGLGEKAWRKGGTRVRRGVEFGREWVLGVRFQASA
jgi:enhancer of mRNA-decapping protein 3